MKQISSGASWVRPAKARSAAALSLHPLATSARLNLAAKRSTSGLSSPEMRATSRPALRASETPMISAKEKRFHSAPSGPHQTPPSVRTPSTSSAMAFTAGISARHSDAPQLLDNRLLALHHALYAVAQRLLDNAHVANDFGNAVGLEGRGLVGPPHGAVERDVAFDAAGAQAYGSHGCRQARLMAGIAHRQAVALAQRSDRPSVQLRIMSGIHAARMQQDQVL